MDKDNVITLDDLRARREDILRIARENRAYNVRVFGSVARGDATAESDVDLLVTFEPDASLYDLSGLWQDLQEFLECRGDVAIDDDHPRNERFLRHARRDAVPL